MAELIKYEDFAKIDLQIGLVFEAKVHPDSNVDKLLVLRVKIGEETRQIVAGIKPHYDPAHLIGKNIVVVMNLEPRNLRGEMSHGMLLAASEGANLALLTVDKPISSGAKVK